MFQVIKPFSNFKWRWATLTPTESLNRPPIFLGVLRAFDRCEGLPPSSIELFDELSRVEFETKSSVSLSRSRDRNLVRNSGQYWRALGVLDMSSRGELLLTDFGKMVSIGKVTQSEFALTTVCTLTLPSQYIDTKKVIDQWEGIGLKIKPLLLILQIIKSLTEFSSVDSYITANELIRLVIPMSGAKYDHSSIAHAIYDYRNNFLNIDNFPDCALGSNDKRMAREFILFLEYYHLLKNSTPYESVYNCKYILDCISVYEIEELEKFNLPDGIIKTYERVISENISDTVERKKISRDIIERPNQQRFRKNILEAYSNRCLITGVDMKNVLEAAHIIPVSENGCDEVSNGICLRTDIHRLFDSGHLLIHNDGKISLSSNASKNQNYGYLPSHVHLPNFVNKDLLYWRTTYL